MAFISGGLGGFKHRLSKMYQDTKNLYEFTEPPKVSDLAPELSSLHRKLRIQKDRLITWGLQWSDPSSGKGAGKGDAGQPADIDESLDKAGLGDVVGSVLATIKEIIAEADPLWQSGRALMGSGGLGGDEKLGGGLSRVGSSEKQVERKGSFVQWDRARFEGLVHDLTISIDTLYDISKNRQRPPSRQKMGSKQSMIGSSSEMETLGASRTTRQQFESSRMQTPQQIDPEILSLPGDPERNFLKAREEGEEELEGRQVVYMRRQHSSNNPWKRDGGIPVVPVLLEYAAFDPIFAATEIPPPMDRFEKLFAGLQTSQNGSQQEFHVPKLIGYFEDMEGARFGLIYGLPKHFDQENGVESDVASKLPMFSTVSDLLRLNSSPPALEGRFRLAYNLATTVFKLLAKDIIHGNVASDNVLFFHKATDHPSLSSHDFDVRQPLLTNFDLFSVTENEGLSSYSNYIEMQDAVHASAKESGRAMDLRGLALLLLEIGLWLPIGDILTQSRGSSNNEKLKISEEDFMWSSKISPRLRVQCGTLYMRAVQSCWHASNLEMIQSSQRDPGIQVKMYWKVVKALEKCCAIDEDFEIDTVDSDTVLGTTLSVLPTVEQHKTPNRPSPPKRSEKSQDIAPMAITNTRRADEKSGMFELSTITRKDVPTKAVLPTPKRKLRLFPTTNISQQNWDDWHDVLMPRINHLLRGFYRKNPESVEISLVSMGETPQRTKPTILAICTSVSQVKSILKKSFSYDKSTYDLKVCKGKILRSRKNRPSKRSMADPLVIEESPAANAKHQLQPRFGASIGACVDGRNLPPVSLGGILQIDGTFYGMSVHHMLDEDEDPDEIDHDDTTNPHRSSGYSAGSDSEGDYYYSSDDVLYSESGTDLESAYEYETEDESMDSDPSFVSEPGDIEGIPVDCGDGYYVTQPAIDDVDDNFFASEDDRDDDHISSHSLGEMWASSGIRRTRFNGQTHEIDWALFTFNKERLPPPTLVQEGQRRFCQDRFPTYPTGIVPSSELRELSVHCMGRSSGLRAGKISTGMTSVKIFGRKTPSQSYEVMCTETTGNMLGIPGDSGAWVVDNGTGRVCGSVLAWSQRKKVAYICPMDLLVHDIAVTVEARKICLGSGKVVLENETEQVAEKEILSNDMNMNMELRRRTDRVKANESDESDDADDEEEEEEEEREEEEDEGEETEEETEEDANETRTIRNSLTNFKIPAAPIRMYNKNTANPRQASSMERDIPDLIPSLDKMRVSTDGTGLSSSKRMQGAFAGSVK